MTYLDGTHKHVVIHVKYGPIFNISITIMYSSLASFKVTGSFKDMGTSWSHKCVLYVVKVDA